MLGLWEYYAATVDAKAPDFDAKSDLSNWGRVLNYTLCMYERWEMDRALCD
jgi:hypothetical protein